jgi:cell division protein ZapA
MAGSFRITLKLAGRDYPLTIDPAEEWRYRKAAKEINELVNLYSKRYSADMENYLAMAALQTALMGIQSGVSEEIEPVLDELRDFEAELEQIPEAKLPTGKSRGTGEG